jgi:hypothetical protein
VHREARGVCSRAALYLSGHDVPAAVALDPIAPLPSNALANYRSRWREQLPAS